MNTVPNKPKTPIRGVRVPDEEWHPAQERAKAEGETMTDVVRRAIRVYNAAANGHRLSEAIRDGVKIVDTEHGDTVHPMPGMSETRIADAAFRRLRPSMQLPEDPEAYRRNLTFLLAEYERTGMREARPDLWAAFAESLAALSEDDTQTEGENHG